MNLRQEMVMYNTANKLLYPELSKTSIAWYWETYWGSFQRALSRALITSDIVNEKKIRDNWTKEIWENIQIVKEYEDKLWN